MSFAEIGRDRLYADVVQYFTLLFLLFFYWHYDFTFGLRNIYILGPVAIALTH